MLTTTKPMAQLLKDWQQAKLITPLDRHFALELAAIEGLSSDDADYDLFLLICAMLSQQLSNQHSCLLISSIELANPMAEDIGHHPYAMADNASCQITVTHQQVIDSIGKFYAVTTVSNIETSDTDTPMILDNGRLYLNKYFFFETQVANKLKQLSQTNIATNNPQLPSYLTALFPIQPELNGQLNWQKIATATALTKALAVITGGPGTGKTTTVTKLLLLLQTQQTESAKLTIRLVAPTGKAAARLSESIKASKNRLRSELAQDNSANQPVLLSALAAIPEEASTLHRLLGVIPHSHQFRHHKDNPLRLDLLVVDEASMVDLPMMYKLLSALPAQARLILLGDQDQLASVEAGAVLADICAGLKNTDQDMQAISTWRMHYSRQQADTIKQLTQQDVSQFISTNQPFGDSLCMLMHSHRFKGDAGIGMLANAVNSSNVDNVRQVWRRGYAELNWFEHQLNHQQDNLGKQQLLTLSVEAYQPYLAMIQANQQDTQHSYSPQQIIEQYNQYRMLCAMRAGEYGVDGMNIAITDSLRQAKLIEPKHEFYLGRPIIIQSNDYNLGLFNGDIGLVLQDELNPSRLMTHFIKADGSLLKVLPARLPKHDTCFAMTVHKSQGSEFDKVSFVLPQRPSVAQWQLLTKELVYTAITRAKNHFYCLGSAQVFERAVKQVTLRASGLAQRLWHN
ncbi:exodeoxyribonuclease V subunit alpha [Shewanella aestuarii]|uniref:RecBCD enzyme subunit RecD n=1 Tax=Shewanella aestuarii TaxID=1028752 RepID=A0A6G9QK56_9GAMM|nr:exodeoxyribonuclease V subunit alpha [Shewanella aestuarii]QIR14842.1 exodeoxyribonuclease V subunit alpha [Shewanella aestuarii]